MTEGKTKFAVSAPFLNKKWFKQGTSLKNLLSCAFIYAGTKQEESAMYCDGSTLMPILHLQNKRQSSLETVLKGAGCSSEE